MSAKLYLEGGGDSKELQSRCRAGFRLLLERSGFEGRMPRLVACGGRGATFDDFCTAHRGAAGSFVAMLVDSEDPVADGEKPWIHFRARDGWEKPQGAVDEQALMMITCMETWIACDRAALQRRFGAELQASGLPALQDLESKSRGDVLQALEHATRDCTPGYEKGRISFEVLGELSPQVLKVLPSFARVVRILQARL